MGRGSLVLFSVLGVFSAATCFAASHVINGNEVAEGDHAEVIQLTAGATSCSATVVGPRVIVTAAHCAATGAVGKFTIDGEAYSAKMIRSSVYPKVDHDLGVGIIDRDVLVNPATIASQVAVGDDVFVVGYGCTSSEGGGEGVLRAGNASVNRMSDLDFITQGKVAICFGDSGGPAYLSDGESLELAGIASMGNLQDTSYFTRLDLAQSQTFLKEIAKTEKVDICGINKDCDSDH